MKVMMMIKMMMLHIYVITKNDDHESDNDEWFQVLNVIKYAEM